MSTPSPGSRLFWSSTYRKPIAGTIVTAATPNTTSTVVSVPDGAAAADTFSEVGSRYGHCATPHAPMTLATAPADSTRAPRAAPRTSRTSEVMPHSPDKMTSGSARDVRPWNT